MSSINCTNIYVVKFNDTSCILFNLSTFRYKIILVSRRMIDVMPITGYSFLYIYIYIGQNFGTVR